MPINVSDDKLVQLFEDVAAIKETTASTKQAVERLDRAVERLDRDVKDVKTFQAGMVVRLAGWFVAAITAVMAAVIGGLLAFGRWVLPRILPAVADAASVPVPFV